MHSIDETPEVQQDWRIELRRQGRTLTWLARETGRTYPQISAYAQGRAKIPEDFIVRVRELLGENVA
jgi:hypothetical protein